MTHDSKMAADWVRGWRPHKADRTRAESVIWVSSLRNSIWVLWPASKRGVSELWEEHAKAADEVPAPLRVLTHGQWSQERHKGTLAAGTN